MSIFNRKNTDDDFIQDEMDLDPEEMEEDEMYSSFPPEARQGESRGSVNLADFRYGDNYMIFISLVLAVILIFASGLLIYKTHALSVENGKLETRVQRDTKLKKSEDEYETETENLEMETDTLINRYGAGNTPEKTILFLANLSSTSGISVTSVEFGTPEVITEDENGNKLKGAAEAPDPAEASLSNQGDREAEDQQDSEQKNKNTKKDNGKDEYYLYKYQASISYTGTYTELKKAIKFIEDYGERTTINDITSTFDDTTQNLTGSMTLNMYTLSGTAQEYKAPSISGSVGTSNIFG